MSAPIFRDLRYIRVPVEDVAMASAYATDVIGLQAAGEADGQRFFRSDYRSYALSYTSEPDAAVAITVASATDLERMEERLSLRCGPVERLGADACARRRIKAGVACRAPNGVQVEFVWRPLTSGWRFHGGFDAGIVGLAAVGLRCRDVAADEAFWTEIVGLKVSDWAGDAVFLRLDDAHHRIALYPSAEDGLLLVDFEVEHINNVMQNFYRLQGLQRPIVHGPGRAPTSGKVFVVTRGPGGVLVSYSCQMAAGAATAAGPRQFPDHASSHCSWGSISHLPEFGGRT